MCKVSVILPSLNVAKYIKQCIESVINQTLNDIEIISVDAGSTDGTAEILKEYAAKDSRIILLHSDVKSYGHQMNLGIKKATGDYIGIVETDDYVETDMFEKLYAVAKNNDADIAKGLMYINYEYENFKNIETFGDYLNPYPGLESTVINPNDDPKVFLYNPNLWNGIYKRDFLDKNQIFFNETAGAAFQDIGFHHQIFDYAQRVVYIKNFLYHYRVLRQGSSSWNDKILRNVYQEYKWLFDIGRLNIGKDTVIFKMAFDMLAEYKKVLQYCDFDVTSINDSGILLFFRKVLLNLNTNDAFSETGIERELYLFLLNNGWFEKAYKRQVDIIHAWWNTFYHNAVKNGLVLFGAGNVGKFLIPFLIRNGLPPIAYLDNNEKLWGTELDFPVKEPFVIQPPQFVFKSHAESTYLIATKKYGNEIKKQLICAGIKENNIVIYDDSDKVLHKALEEVLYLIQK